MRSLQNITEKQALLEGIFDMHRLFIAYLLKPRPDQGIQLQCHLCLLFYCIRGAVRNV